MTIMGRVRRYPDRVRKSALTALPPVMLAYKRFLSLPCSKYLASSNWVPYLIGAALGQNPHRYVD